MGVCASSSEDGAAVWDEEMGKAMEGADDRVVLRERWN